MALSWTEEEHKLLEKMLDEGNNIREIENSGHFDYNYSKIWHYARKHDLKTNTYNRKCVRCKRSVGGRASHTEYCKGCAEVRSREHGLIPKELHKPHPNIWTEDDEEKLKELTNQGLTYEEIGRVLGRTTIAVDARTRMIGLNNKNKPMSISAVRLKKRRESVERLVNKGLTMKEISKELNVNYNTITQDVKKLGLEPVHGRKHVRYSVSCSLCGDLFESGGANAKYCRPCRRSTNNEKYMARNQKRLEKMKANGEVDYSINLDDLFTRDRGRCHLCGGVCSFDDHYSNEKASFIVGGTYPSIDHVLPIAKGGAHSWGNVNLAHHFCNSQKNMSTSNVELYPIPAPSNPNLGDA